MLSVEENYSYYEIIDPSVLETGTGDLLNEIEINVSLHSFLIIFSWSSE